MIVRYCAKHEQCKFVSALSKLNLLGETDIIIPILKLIQYESINDKVDVNNIHT